MYNMYMYYVQIYVYVHVITFCGFYSYSFQPAPFFVLDEIDAALDNTNINRVNICVHKY